MSGENGHRGQKSSLVVEHHPAPMVIPQRIGFLGKPSDTMEEATQMIPILNIFSFIAGNEE